MRFRLFVFLLSAAAQAGCGTTRWTDTSRTATEQMLISDAIERSVSRIDFHVLEGQTVFLDTTYLSSIVDKDYLVSTLRQHMVASGCTIKDKRENADYVIEARAGAVGTDRHELLFGMPSLNLPWTPMQGAPAALPEVALARRTDQKGVAKVAVFAYHRTSGAPVWQSGVDSVASKAQNSWWLGVGPIQRGTIYDKAQFAGREFRFPMLGRKEVEEPRTVRVTRETLFNDPQRFAYRSGDDLTKFGESLRGADPVSTEASFASVLGGPSLAFAGGAESQSIFSASRNFSANPLDVPVDSEGNGAVIGAPKPDTAPTARLIGPRRPLPLIR